MKRLALIFVLLCGSALAQTSVSCSAAGACGNLLDGTLNTGGNTDLLYGITVKITSGSFTATNIKMVTDTGSGTIYAILVCDNNTTGSTIAASGNCPANNVICSLSQAYVSDTTMTFSLSGCGTLSTTARYWLFLNSNGTAGNYHKTPTNSTSGAGAVSAWFQALTCCTIPTSVTGAFSDGAENLDLQVTLASTGGGGAAAFNKRKKLANYGVN